VAACPGLTLINVDDEKVVKNLTPDMIQRAAFTPDSRRVIAPGHNGELLIWSTSDGSELKKIKLSETALVWAAVSPTGHLFAATDHLGKMWVLDARNYKILATIELEKGAAAEEASYLVGFSKDRRYLVAVSMTGKVKVFASGH
jgi:WD40 repeat protein